MRLRNLLFSFIVPTIAFAASDNTQAGRVQFALRTSSNFNIYTDNPAAANKAWMSTHFWRLQSSSPYWDSKLSWMPNTWAYINLYAIYPGSQTFIDHPDWILRDSAGNKLFIPWGCSGGTCPQYAADLSNQSYRNWWISQAATELARGYKGVWIDDVNMELRVSNGNGATVTPFDPNTFAPMTADNWRRYMVEMLEQVRSALPGYEILHNSIWFSSPTEYKDQYVIREIKAADYIIAERGFSDPNLVAGTGPFSMGDFLNFIDTVHSYGKNIVLDEYHQNGEFGLAGYYLISNGGDALGNQDVTPDNFWSGYTTDLGSPIGNRTSWFGLYRRDYTGGMVLLNPMNSPTVTVTLPGRFTRLDGTNVTSLTLTAGQAAVLPGTVATNITSPISVNAGGGNVGTFMADAFFTGGHASNLATSVSVTGVVNAAPQAVYMSKHTSDNSSGFTYTFLNLVPGTKYRLRLHFADDLSWKAGMRVFHVDVNSVRALTNFDVFANTGALAKAYVKTFQVTANAMGNVKVVFTPIVGNALVNGIEIIP